MKCPICKNSMAYARKQDIEHTELYVCHVCGHAHYITTIFNQHLRNYINKLILNANYGNFNLFYKNGRNELFTIPEKTENLNKITTWKECYKVNRLDKRTNRCKNCYNLYDCCKLREQQQQIQKRSKEIEKSYFKFCTY